LDITQVFMRNLTNFAKGQEWSIQKLCRILGIGVNSFYRWRGGRTNISMETAQGLVEKLNTELEADMRLQYFLGEPQTG